MLKLALIIVSTVVLCIGCCDEFGIMGMVLIACVLGFLWIAPPGAIVFGFIFFVSILLWAKLTKKREKDFAKREKYFLKSLSEEEKREYQTIKLATRNPGVTGIKVDKEEEDFLKSLSEKEKREYKIIKAASRFNQGSSSTQAPMQVDKEKEKRLRCLPEHMSDDKIRYLVGKKIVKTKREEMTPIDQLNHKVMLYILKQDIECRNEFIDFINSNLEAEYLFAQRKLIAIFPQTMEAKRELMLEEKIEYAKDVSEHSLTDTTIKYHRILLNEINKLCQSLTQEKQKKYSPKIKTLEDRVKWFEQRYQ